MFVSSPGPFLIWKPTLQLRFERRYWLAMAVALMLSAAGVDAQPPEPPKPATAPMAAADDTRPIREAGPPVLYLRDKKGELRVVPSLTMEELDRLLQLDRGVPTGAPPRFTFAEAIQLTGTARDTLAELEATFTIRLTAPPDSQAKPDWIRVPLRLNQAILTASIQTNDGTELPTEYQPNGDGYVVWIPASLAPETKISLKIKLPLEVANGEKQLVLAVPNRSTTLKLAVDSPEAEGRIESSSFFEKRRSDSGGTEFSVEGNGGTIQLVWRDKPEAPPVLQSEGIILVTLDGRSFDIEGQLKVRSYGPPIDSFTLRLPQGVQLLGSNQAVQPGLQISTVNTPQNGNSGRIGQLVNVRRLDGKTSNPIEVRLKATSTGASGSGAVDLSGFEVLNAQIQRGIIDFALEGDWSVEWKTDTNVRRVDVPEALRSQQVVARFEYSRQPFSLRAVVGKGEPQINVEPTYVVSVEPEQLKLDASLKYRISGARADKVTLDRGGWIIDRIGPVELIDGTWKVDNGTVEIPLSSAASASRGEFELQIAAHQDTRVPPISAFVPLGLSNVPVLAMGPIIGEPWLREIINNDLARDVTFNLPRPNSSGATPGVLIIQPADNIELTPSTDQLRSLTPDSLPAQAKLATRQQPPLVYREDLVGQPPTFVGIFKVREQSISIAAENLVRVEEKDLTVEQRMTYTIAYEPASRLTFEVPRTLRESGSLSATLDGNPVTMTPIAATTTSADRQIVAVELREKRIGDCEIQFKYQTNRLASPVAKSSAFTAALVRPITSQTTRVASCSLRLNSPAAFRLSLVDDQMRPIEDETSGATMGNDLVFQLDQVPAHVSLAVTATETTAKRTTIVDRIWVQSLLTNTERRDRACFRLSTNESFLRFTLPPGAGSDDISIVVDGQRSERVTINGRDVRLELGELLASREMTIELVYWFTANPAMLGKLNLQAPQLADASHADRVFWELKLPANEHLVWSAPNLISENYWRWNGLFLSRDSRLSQSELEQWVKAAQRTEDQGFNSYVFSSIGVSGPNTVITAIRPFGMLVAAGGVFAIGVLLLYVPALRHPLFLLALGAVTVALAISFPEPSLAAAQLMVLGLVLVLLVRLLMTVLIPQPVIRVRSRGSTYGFSEGRLVNGALRRGDSRVDSGSDPGTATLSAPFQMSATTDQP